jgi:hypothetical protein
MWESSEPCGRVEPPSGIRRETEYAMTRIPVLRHRNRRPLGTGGGLCRPPMRLLSQRSGRSRAALHCSRRVKGDVGYDETHPGCNQPLYEGS